MYKEKIINISGPEHITEIIRSMNGEIHSLMYGWTIPTILRRVYEYDDKEYDEIPFGSHHEFVREKFLRAENAITCNRHWRPTIGEG